jgi:HAD superfamily hydrolase (TIGR01484 family)
VPVGAALSLPSQAVEYRAIATDLDGTLLRSDQSISPRTRDAICAAEEAGLLVVIATGRPPRWIAPVVEQLGDRGLVVCANGATVYDPAEHRIVHRNDIPADVALSIVDDVQQAFPEALLGVEQGFDFGIDDAAQTASFDFRDQPVTKLIIRMPHPAPPGTAVRVQEVVGTRALVTHSTNESFLEVSSPTAHKATTVEMLLLEHGLAAPDVVAFGDMPNDLELIRWAGLGVAMANAHPQLKAEADLVTASNDEDGVAQVLEERVLS